MKASVYNLKGEKVKEIILPKQFSESYHPDLIKRAVLVIQANKRQPYGAHPEAGKRASVTLSKRRRDYRGIYGRGASRIPRKVLWRRGSQFGWVGAFVPGTVKGRKAHPPKEEKIWEQKINKKERKKAIRSALAATLDKTLVEERGHVLPNLFPLIIESNIESLSKTKEVKKTLDSLGLKEELKRVLKKKVRAGKGKLRGRKYKKKVGPLIIVSDNCKLEISARNIPGIDVIRIKDVNTELLAPGAQAGRLTLYTDKAIEKLEKEKLFINKVKEK